MDSAIAQRLERVLRHVGISDMASLAAMSEHEFQEVLATVHVASTQDGAAAASSSSVAVPPMPSEIDISEFMMAAENEVHVAMGKAMLVFTGNTAVLEILDIALQQVQSVL